MRSAQLSAVTALGMPSHRGCCHNHDTFIYKFMDEPQPAPGSRALPATASAPIPAFTPAASLSRGQVERSYRRYAPVYDFLFGASLGPGRVAMTRLVDTLSPSDLLEVGVGTGLTLSQYPKRARITGVDVSPEMLATARARIPKDDVGRIDLRVMDAEALDFPDNSFDCVTIPYVLSVTPNPDKLVSEVRRVCRPGAHILIVNHFSGQASWRLLEKLARPLAGWLGFRSEFSLEHHVMRHDWEVISIAPVNFLSLSRLIHLRNV
ncbi:MAG: methyltransferase domain-containing protein [Variovorax sp.]|nr:MAG: methyltransferase domain-containing protein [Variovorax sp.]